MTKLKILLIVLFSLFSTSYNSIAQQDINLEELKESYFKDKKFSDFVDYLKTLSAEHKIIDSTVNYYIALSRYSQLKYLEETQNWNEYFGQGNNYRSEIVNSCQKTISSVKAEDPLGIYARLLLWQFYKDQQDAVADASLSGLFDSVVEYSKAVQDTMPIKEVADKLLVYQEKGKSKALYKIYVDKIITSNVEDEELKNIGLRFYKEGNLDLSEVVYDVYIDRIIKSLPTEKSVPILADIAKLFMYRNEGANDPLYAEKVFKRMEDAGGKKAFNEELIYLRAFNLEKAKDFLAAKDNYIDLVQRYPNSPFCDEANYKVGVILTYVLGNRKSGKEYFEKLAQKEPISPHTISSLYQLGLLSQWESDLAKASDYYVKLMERSKEDYTETVALVRERLKEIEEARSINYNLKMFLDIALKREAAGTIIQSNINVSVYKPKKEEAVKITSAATLPESGCMPVELEYLWSGNTGKTNVSQEQILSSASIDSVYTESGTKVVNLVVVSPASIIDASIDMLDVH